MAKTRFTLIFQLHLKLLIQSTKRVCIIEVFFLKKICENFVGTLETVGNREVSTPRGSTVLRNTHS